MTLTFECDLDQIAAFYIHVQSTQFHTSELRVNGTVHLLTAP